MTDERERFELDDSDREMERGVRAAFAAQRPRPGFASELRGRFKRRESLWDRVFGAPALRTLAPAVGLLIIAVGVIAFFANPPHFGGAATSTGAPASLATSGFRGGFGVLPAPAGTSAPGSSEAPAGGQTASRPSAADGNSVGAPLTAAGLPAFPTQAPVFRYTQPRPEARVAALSAIAASSGLPVHPPAPFNGEVAGEPSYFATLSEPVRAGPLATAAEAFLTAHGLAPGFQFLLKVGLEGIVFERVFSLPDGTTVPQVTTGGAPAGTRVAISGSRVISVSGPLELPLEQASYPLRPVAAIRSQQPVGPPAAAARLVYVAVADPDGIHGYFEPAYLFSGQGPTLLVAAVAAQYLSH